LKNFCAEQGIARIDEIIGSLKIPDQPFIH